MPRAGGRKIHFHKDRPLGAMTTINLIYEWLDRFLLAEFLAYEVYRKAGVPAPRTDFVRTWIDGRPSASSSSSSSRTRRSCGTTRSIRAATCTRRTGPGATLVDRHEKKTNTPTGHADLTDLMDRLTKVKGDDQWAVIKKEFNVEEMINLYATRMILSDWDGFFNNYFLYHDTGSKTKKWMMYPWDQDKTWGYHDGIRANEVFVDMPITFGMEGDKPPPGTGGFGSWWRPGGDISRPLLANPTFRKHFLARTKELLETVYTEEAFGPIIKALGERLEEEVKLRATTRREDPKQAVEQFKKNLDSLREHLTKRREFLLKQEEIKKAGKFDPKELK